MVVGEFITDVDVLVIGAGPGGYVAAIRAAQHGKKVTLVEKQKLGGSCLNVGCIPSKALISAAARYEEIHQASEIGITAKNIQVDFSKVQSWKTGIVNKLTSGIQGLLKGNNVEIMQGEAFFVNEKEVQVINGYEANRLRFQHCIIATGSSPIELPGFPLGRRILTSTEALELQDIPRSLVVIGGGYIGIELGQTYAKLGSKVTILEGADSILSGFEQRLVSQVERKLKKQGVEIITKAKAIRAETSDDHVTTTYEVGGEEKQVIADYVLVTVGRRPNTKDLECDSIGMKQDDKGFISINDQCQTNIPNIYAIGDVVTGPALAHKASYEGKVAAEVIAGKSSGIDYSCIPSVIFSDPEIATVGLSQDEAKKQGYDVQVGTFSYAASGRALALSSGEGSVTLIGDRQTGLILGAQIVGLEASNLIAEIGLAIEMGSSFGDVSLTVHAHPTLGEMVMEAAESAMGHGIHSL